MYVSKRIVSGEFRIELAGDLASGDRIKRVVRITGNENRYNIGLVNHWADEFIAFGGWFFGPVFLVQWGRFGLVILESTKSVSFVYPCKGVRPTGSSSHS